jgi:hypothetical protein
MSKISANLREVLGPEDRRVPGMQLDQRDDDRVPGGWRTRRGLLLAVVLPALALGSLGAVRLAGALGSAGSAAQARTMAALTADSASLAAALGTERDGIMRFVALGSSSPGGLPVPAGRGSHSLSSADYRLEAATLNRSFAATDRLVRRVRTEAAAIGDSYPAAARRQAASELSALGGLAGLRQAATQTRLPALPIISQYASVVSSVLAVGGNVTLGGGDAVLNRTARELALVAAIREDAAQEQAILTSALSSDLTNQGNFGPDKIAALQSATADQGANQTELGFVADPSGNRLFQDALSAPQVARALAQRDAAVALAQSGVQDPTIGLASTGMAYVSTSLGRAESQLAAAESGRAAALRSRAILAIAGYGLLLAALIVLLLLVFRPGPPRPLRISLRPLRRALGWLGSWRLVRTRRA